MNRKCTVRIGLKHEVDGGDISVFAKDDQLLFITKDGENDEILDGRTTLDTLARQDTDNVTIMGAALPMSLTLQLQMAARA
jgi:hypothetical protein